MIIVDFFKIILDILIAFFFPYLLWLRVIYEFLKKSRYLKIVFALALSLAYFHYIPDEDFDLSRHYLLFDNYHYYKDQMLLLSKYTGLGELIIIVDYLGLPKEVIAFSCSFLLFYVMIFAANIKVEKINKLGPRFIVYFLFLVIPSYITLVIGLRWGFAFSFFCLSVIFYSKNKILSCIFIVLSVIFHFGFSLILLIYFVSNLINVTMLNRVRKVNLLIFLLIVSFLFYSILPYLLAFFNVGELLGRGLDGYTTGTFGFGYLNTLAPWRKYLTIFSHAITFGVFALFFLENRKKNTLLNFTSVFFCVCIIMSLQYVVSSRYLPCVIFCYLFYINYESLNKYKISKTLLMIYMVIVFNFILGFVIYRDLYLSVYI